jgi:hypothetical protein
VVPELWAGIDAGKAEHHCTVINTDGTKLLSRRVPNNEPELLDLVRDVLDLADDSPVTWAVDLNAGGAALLIAVLIGHGQRLLYIPGRTVHHASASYRGDGMSDAKDAFIIADQARMRRDLQPLQDWDEIAVDLKIRPWCLSLPERATGGGVLPHEPDRAAARAAVRDVVRDRVPGRATPRAASRVGAGAPPSRGRGAVVDRGWHPGPGPRSQRGRVFP